MVYLQTALNADVPCRVLSFIMPRLKAIPSPRFMHFHLSQFKGERDSSCYNVYEELFIR